MDLPPGRPQKERRGEKKRREEERRRKKEERRKEEGRRRRGGKKKEEGGEERGEEERGGEKKAEGRKKREERRERREGREKIWGILEPNRHNVPNLPPLRGGSRSRDGLRSPGKYLFPSGKTTPTQHTFFLHREMLLRRAFLGNFF